MAQPVIEGAGARIDAFEQFALVVLKNGAHVCRRAGGECASQGLDITGDDGVVERNRLRIRTQDRLRRLRQRFAHGGERLSQARSRELLVHIFP
jgi:hypothetical protein